MKLSNTPHAWSPYFIVGVGHPDQIKWTVQYQNGELSNTRFDHSKDAEDHAIRMARFDNALSAIERRVLVLGALHTLETEHQYSFVVGASA